MILPHSVCYSHFGNEVRIGAISITQLGFINDCYKVKPVDQWGKFLVMAMGFQITFGFDLKKLIISNHNSMRIQLPYQEDINKSMFLSL